jgi:hypothetical protein
MGVRGAEKPTFLPWVASQAPGDHVRAAKRTGRGRIN